MPRFGNTSRLMLPAVNTIKILNRDEEEDGDGEEETRNKHVIASEDVGIARVSAMGESRKGKGLGSAVGDGGESFFSGSAIKEKKKVSIRRTACT